MFTALRNRKPNGDRKLQDQTGRRRLTRNQKIFATAGVLGLALAVVLTTLIIKVNAAPSTQDDQYGAMATDTFPGISSPGYAVHLDASGMIDKAYTDDELDSMSPEERMAEDVVVFYHDGNYSQVTSSIAVPATLNVDEVSYPIDVKFSGILDTKAQEISAYNALVSADPTVSLRGKRDVSSLGLYVLDVVTPKIATAINSGVITAPTVEYDGTTTLVTNDDVAAASKAGVSPEVLIPTCAPGAACITSGAKYDFSCKTVGIRYTNWDTFKDQVRELLQAPSIRITDPSLGTVALDTEDPCRVSGAEGSYMPGPGNESTPVSPPPVNEGGYNGPGDTGGF